MEVGRFHGPENETVILALPAFPCSGMVVEVEEFDRLSWSSSQTPDAANVTLIYNPSTTIHERCDAVNTSLANYTAANFTIEPGEVWRSLLTMISWLAVNDMEYVQMPYFQIGTTMTPPNISADGTFYEFQLSTQTHGDQLIWECLNNTEND